MIILTCSKISSIAHCSLGNVNVINLCSPVSSKTSILIESLYSSVNVLDFSTSTSSSHNYITFSSRQFQINSTLVQFNYNFNNIQKFTKVKRSFGDHTLWKFQQNGKSRKTILNNQYLPITSCIWLVGT